MGVSNPGGAGVGMIGTDWVLAGPTVITATTTAPTKGTTATDEVWWRRVGGNMEVRMGYRQTTAGTAGTGDYLFALPTVNLIDTTKLTPTTTLSVAGSTASVAPSDNSVGSWVLGDTANDQECSGAVVVYNSTQVRLMGGLFATTSSNPVVVGAVSGVGLNHSTGLSLAITFSVPIQGWVSNASTVLAPVTARYFSSSTTITSSLATVIYSTKDWDTVNGYSSGIYTCQQAGYYQVNASIAMTGTFLLNSILDLQVVQGGSSSHTAEAKDYSGGATTQMNTNVGDIFNLAINDTLQVKASNSGTTPIIAATTTQNWLSIKLLS